MKKVTKKVIKIDVLNNKSNLVYYFCYKKLQRIEYQHIKSIYYSNIYMLCVKRSKIATKIKYNTK